MLMFKRFGGSILVLMLLSPFCFAASAERPLLISLQGTLAADAPTHLSIAQLDEMPQIKKVIFDPFLDKTTHYRGVPLKEFVARFARPETKTIKVGAIDENAVTFFRQELETGGYLLATRMDGVLMTRAMGGPAKIVLQTEDPENHFVRKWICMINRIEFLAD